MYDEIIFALLVISYLLKGIFIRRESLLGWSLAFQAFCLASLFLYALARRIDADFPVWPVTYIRFTTLVSCILTIVVLFRERFQVWRLNRGAMDTK